MKKTTSRHTGNCYIIGGGLAALATAVYLIRYGNISGKQITLIYEKEGLGGCIEAEAKPGSGSYFLAGYRMLEGRVYSALFDLLSFVPSIETPETNLLDEINMYNAQFMMDATARLVSRGKVDEEERFDLNWKDQIRILWFLALPEKVLKNKSIEDYFSAAFFESRLWIELSTTFAFQPWHSVCEFRRYIRRFIHSAPDVDSMNCVRMTPVNEYEFIIAPLRQWLLKRNVQFIKGKRVSELEFTVAGKGKRVSAIRFSGIRSDIPVEVEPDDLVFASLGSITSGAVRGSMNTVPPADACQGESAWFLWKNIAGKDPALGNPAVFSSSIEKTSWVSFTVTFRDRLFPDLLNSMTLRKTGEEGIVTLRDSNWLLSFAMTPKPFFSGQSKETNIMWGYGLFPEKSGDFIRKKMSACTGKEILIELCSHLGFSDVLPGVLKSSECIPCYMPYITSQFMPRNPEDRPEVLPDGIDNLALLGQYCNIPDSIVFTLDHSVRTAQVAVAGLMGLKRNHISKIYKGYRNPIHLCRAAAVVFRQNNHIRKILMKTRERLAVFRKFFFMKTITGRYLNSLAEKMGVRK